MIQRLGQRLTHHARRADHAVEAGQRDHFQNGRHAAPLLPYQPSGGTEELDFGGGVAPVTELVLEPLDPHRIQRAVRQHPGQQEAADALAGLGQHQMGVAHGRGEEELVPHQPVAAILLQQGLGGIGAHIRAALFLGHAHAYGAATLLGSRQGAGIVFTGQQARYPLGSQFGTVAQGGNGRIGHGQRAAGTGIGLAVQVHQTGTGDMGTGALLIVPGKAVHLAGHGGGHQLVVGRMELNLVDAPTVPIEAVQFRAVPVGQLTGLHQLMTGQLAQRIQFFTGPVAAVAGDGLLQRQITAPEVVAGHGLGLVVNFMGKEPRFDRHCCYPPQGMPRNYTYPGEDATGRTGGSWACSATGRESGLRSARRRYRTGSCHRSRSHV